jgi:hypothetical protein
VNNDLRDDSNAVAVAMAKAAEAGLRDVLGKRRRALEE